MELPNAYANQMKELLGEGYSEYLNSFRLSSHKGFRVNENKISVKDFLELWEKSGFPKPEKIPWIHNGFFVPDGFDAAKTDLYEAGLYYIQEPAAMSPAEYLPVDKGDRVLDLCAAPGGKSTELLSKLHGTGVLYSNDISASRAKALKKNLEMAGAVNACVTAEDPKILAGYYSAYFQKILVDAPCSGEGMFRVQPAMMRHWQEHGPKYYAPIQREILNTAYRMLAPGGMLMYSTCTFSRTEDEDQIFAFLKEHPDMEPVPLPERDGFERLADDNGMPMPYVRLYPHRIRGEGQFMALLKRKDAEKEEQRVREQGIKEQGPEKQGIKEQRVREQGIREREIKEQEPEEQGIKDTTTRGRKNRQDGRNIWTKGDEIYLLPEGTKIEKGIHYLMTGLHIGTVKNGFLVPSQAYAMSLKCDAWPDVLDLQTGDPRVRKYLKGETIELTDSEVIPNAKGRVKKKEKIAEKRERTGKYSSKKRKKGTPISLDELPRKDLTLVCTGGWPLGFGKRNRNLLKNLRNAGWRIQT